LFKIISRKVFILTVFLPVSIRAIREIRGKIPSFWFLFVLGPSAVHSFPRIRVSAQRSSGLFGFSCLLVFGRGFGVGSRILD
jgi:hypothetical protein